MALGVGPAAPPVRRGRPRGRLPALGGLEQLDRQARRLASDGRSLTPRFKLPRTCAAGLAIRRTSLALNLSMKRSGSSGDLITYTHPRRIKIARNTSPVGTATSVLRRTRSPLRTPVHFRFRGCGRWASRVAAPQTCSAVGLVVPALWVIKGGACAVWLMDVALPAGVVVVFGACTVFSACGSVRLLPALSLSDRRADGNSLLAGLRRDLYAKSAVAISA